MFCRKAVCVVFGLITAMAATVSGEPMGRQFVVGGQFKDLILPMPIVDGLESEGIWGNTHVIPRDKDNGIEDNQWSYWGGNPIKGHDGKYHIAVCRWPEEKGHGGWHKSEVTHCVSEDPIGPYKTTKTIVKEGHNPEVLKLPDGTFALHVHNGNSVYTANKMEGPWQRMGSMQLKPRGFKASDRFGSNLSTEYRPDGSIVVMKKDGDVAISNSGVLGPYQMVSIHNYSRATGYPEDPVIWRSRHQYHCIYNHAQDRKSAYMRSLDGIHWKNEAGVPYDVSTTFYIDGTKNEWYKFERPKILQDDLGRASHLSLAIMDVSKGEDKGNDNHSSKNMIVPLVIEKVITLIDQSRITPKTNRLVLKIEAEEGFNPQMDLDIPSLRFGSDSIVNYGGGCKAVKTKAEGKDLLVYFEGQNGFTPQDFDFKLIGQTKKGDLVFGYALLPGKFLTAASLISLPIEIKEVKGKWILESAIENWGLEVSKVQKVVVFQYSDKGRDILREFQVSSLKPYGSTKVEIPLDGYQGDKSEYDIVIPGTGHEFWRMVNHTDPSVTFKGDWQDNGSPDENCYMDSEKVSDTLGDVVTLAFHGTRARAYGRLGRQMGTLAVYVDGTYMETIRCNYAPAVHIKIYQTPLLSDGKHTLELKKVKADFNGEVAVDSFSFESSRNRKP